MSHPATPDNTPSIEPTSVAVVVLIHGLGAPRWSMALLAHRLRNCGFTTINWSYHSLLQGVAYHGNTLRTQLESLSARSEVTQLHLVGHSMGCIVARFALLEPLEKVERMVMLCPPNGGSHVASPFASSVGRLCRPVAELSALPTSLVNQLPPCENVEFGVIAAKYDILIRQSETHLEGEHDHIVTSSSHALAPLQKRVAKQTVAFLETGRFLQPD